MEDFIALLKTAEEHLKKANEAIKQSTEITPARKVAAASKLRDQTQVAIGELRDRKKTLMWELLGVLCPLGFSERMHSGAEWKFEINHRTTIVQMDWKDKHGRYNYEALCEQEFDEIFWEIAASLLTMATKNLSDYLSVYPGWLEGETSKMMEFMKVHANSPIPA